MGRPRGQGARQDLLLLWRARGNAVRDGEAAEVGAQRARARLRRADALRHGQARLGDAQARRGRGGDRGRAAGLDSTRASSRWRRRSSSVRRRPRPPPARRREQRPPPARRRGQRPLRARRRGRRRAPCSYAPTGSAPPAPSRSWAGAAWASTWWRRRTWSSWAGPGRSSSTSGGTRSRAWRWRRRSTPRTGRCTCSSPACATPISRASCVISGSAELFRAPPGDAAVADAVARALLKGAARRAP